ncbi:MAG: acyl-[acyl-carrier-protein] thioesterase [Acidobacteriota bacterium]
MSAGAPAVWPEDVRVRASEADAAGLLSPRALCDWLQEAAGNHATALGWAVDQLAGRGLTWVLSRLHLRVTRYPAWRESVRVETWPAGAERLYAVREFRLTGTDEEELAVATSGWLLVDLASRRPQRPPAEIHEMARNTPARVIPDRFERLGEVAASDGSESFTARASEVDLNGHVNNVALIAWVLDSAPHEHLETHRLAELEVEFRAESRQGDRVVSRWATDGATRLHAVTREADGRELLRARTVWAPR